MKSTPPKPEDYPNYEDYLAAVKLHEKFEKKVQEVDQVLAKTTTEAEFQSEMEKLGFEYYEDEYCDDPWCQKHQQCLWITIECLEELLIETCFASLLPEKEWICSKQQRHTIACKIPASWKTADARKTIDFALQLEDAWHDNQRNVAIVDLFDTVETRDMGRALHHLLQATLIVPDQRKRAAACKTISTWIQNTPLLNSVQKNTLHKQLLQLRDTN